MKKNKWLHKEYKVLLIFFFGLCVCYNIPFERYNFPLLLNSNCIIIIIYIVYIYTHKVIHLAYLIVLDPTQLFCLPSCNLSKRRGCHVNLVQYMPLHNKIMVVLLFTQFCFTLRIARKSNAIIISQQFHNKF